MDRLLIRNALPVVALLFVCFSCQQRNINERARIEMDSILGILQRYTCINDTVSEDSLISETSYLRIVRISGEDYRKAICSQWNDFNIFKSNIRYNEYLTDSLNRIEDILEVSIGSNYITFRNVSESDTTHRQEYFSLGESMYHYYVQEISFECAQTLSINKRTGKVDKIFDFICCANDNIIAEFNTQKYLEFEDSTTISLYEDYGSHYSEIGSVDIPYYPSIANIFRKKDSLIIYALLYIKNKTTYEQVPVKISIFQRAIMK